MSGFDPDGPLPDILKTNASKSTRERMIRLARDEWLTIRQLAQRAQSYAGLAFVGTLESIADEMEQWLGVGSDGFSIMSPDCRVDSTSSSTGPCPNCSDAGWSGRNMTVRRYSTISDCRVRPIASFQGRDMSNFRQARA